MGQLSAVQDEQGTPQVLSFFGKVVDSLEGFWKVATREQKQAYFVNNPREAWMLDPLWVMNHGRLNELTQAQEVTMNLAIAKYLHESGQLDPKHWKAPQPQRPALESGGGGGVDDEVEVVSASERVMAIDLEDSGKLVLEQKIKFEPGINSGSAGVS